MEIESLFDYWFELLFLLSGHLGMSHQSLNSIALPNLTVEIAHLWRLAHNSSSIGSFIWPLTNHLLLSIVWQGRSRQQKARHIDDRRTMKCCACWSFDCLYPFNSTLMTQSSNRHYVTKVLCPHTMNMSFSALAEFGSRYVRSLWR